MLVNSVVIILHEVLEAVLLIGILLAVSHRMELRQKWLVGAFAIGLIGAVAYARNIAQISELFAGAGQEIANAILQTGIFFSLVVCVYLIARYRGQPESVTRSLSGAMAVAVALALVQEGSEAFIYIVGYVQLEEFVSGVSIGSVVGFGIGISIGILFYYFLLALPADRAFWVGLALLAFAGSSMVLQAIQLLSQGDILTTGQPVWDSSRVVSESSIVGEFLNAFVGYEATPSATELIVFVAGYLTIATAALTGLGTRSINQLQTA
jgi:high-affinity iron transporter